MTRNEWITTRAEKLDEEAADSFSVCIRYATADADALEAAGVAPWQIYKTELSLLNTAKAAAEASIVFAEFARALAVYRDHLAAKEAERA